MTLYQHYGLPRLFSSAHKNGAVARIKGRFYGVKERVESYFQTEFRPISTITIPAII